jgi:GNAT superfamily N-acetyltransferase
MPVDDESPRDNPLGLTIREAGVDCWSAVRHLHATAFRTLAAPMLETTELAAFAEWVYSPDYTDLLQTQDLQTVWRDGILVGTAGWVPADDTGASARLTAVYVSPLFTRLGIGRQLVGLAEARARAAGFSAFTARVFPPALAFFQRLGYERSSHGAVSIGSENGIPVVFLRKGEPPTRAAAGGEPDRTSLGRPGHAPVDEGSR